MPSGGVHPITYMLLDMTPLGRQERGAGGDLEDWVRHRDRYAAPAEAEATAA